MPEALFDEDNPGHYTRRLKSVSLTVAVGERLVDAIRCTLAILRGSVRTSASTAGGYARTGPEDPRFEDGETTHSIDAIAVWRQPA